MRSLLTALLLLLSAAAYAGPGDFIKATVNGRPYALTGDSLRVQHEAGGSPTARYQSYVLVAGSGYNLPQTLELSLCLPVGAAPKAGIYHGPLQLEGMETRPPYARLQLAGGPASEPVSWSMREPADGEIVITSVKGNVVEGTFRGKLHAPGQDGTAAVTNGAFRFTME